MSKKGYHRYGLRVNCSYRRTKQYVGQLTFPF